MITRRKIIPKEGRTQVLTRRPKESQRKGEQRVIKKGVRSEEGERESKKGRGVVGPEWNWGLEAGYIGIIQVVMRRKILKTCHM